MLHRGMLFFARAVVYGFGLSLGAALFKKVQGRLGLEEDKKPPDPDIINPDGAVDPSTHGV